MPRQGFEGGADLRDVPSTLFAWAPFSQVCGRRGPADTMRTDGGPSVSSLSLSLSLRGNASHEQSPVVRNAGWGWSFGKRRG